MNRCKNKCQFFEENRWRRVSKFPWLKHRQKKCKTCEYACYVWEFDGSLKCPCCMRQFEMRLNH